MPVPTEGYDPSSLEAVQLEDGSTAYIHHPAAVPADSTILAVQTEVGLEDLAAEDDEGFSADTVVALEQYASKVSSPSLTAHQLSRPCPLCHLLSGRDRQCWDMAWPLPQPRTPLVAPHIFIQDVHPARPGLPTAVYTHPVCAASARGGSCEQQ